MDRVMESVSVVVVPVPGLRVIHATLSLADQVSVPLPGLVTFRSLAAGFAPPCVPANERLEGLRLRAGCAVTVREAVRV